MRITGGQSLCSHFDQHLLARRVTSLHLRAETLMEFSPECANHTAGLVVMYNSINWHYAFISADDEGRPVVGVSTCENGELTDRAEIALPGGGTAYRLSAEVNGAELRFFLQTGDMPGQPISPVLDMCILSDEHVRGNGFTSAMIGVCCQDLQGNGCHADFAWFDYEVLD